MIINKMDTINWNDIKDIYFEAFPKAERKPFFTLKHAVKKGKAEVYIATDNDLVIGFIVCYPKEKLVMVDYLAVSNKIRSKGTGSQLLTYIKKIYSDKSIVLLIEKLDDNANNQTQRIARRRFYVKNGFESSNIFIDGSSGQMEVLIYGQTINSSQFLSLFEHVLGTLFYKLSHTRLIQQTAN